MEGDSSATVQDPSGSRKISRKITACTVCRKQKIKCHMPTGSPPCSRCKRRGISCAVHKSLHSILEGDTDWKNGVIERLRSLETAMSKVADAASLSGIHDLLVHAPTPQPMLSTAENEDTALSPQHENEERAWEIDMDAAGGAAAIPASHLIERVSSSTLSPTKTKFSRNDIVSQGVLKLDRASELFNLYHDGYDHFVYRILGEDRSFESVRSSSPMLLSAICAVSALQSASVDFEKCYKVFLRLCSSRAFSRVCTLEDIQAYVIGAFWLNNISWNLVGAAVRAANQLQLHLSIYQALDGDKESYLRTRLFYLVYICDHQFSILYGRLPMTGSNSDAIKSWRSFTRSKHAIEDDTRLASQIQVWRIYSCVQDTFGTNIEASLPLDTLHEVRAFVTELDQYRAEWNESYSTNIHIGNYPNKGLVLHHQFAKLYVCSHVFRGRNAIEPGMSSDLDEIVNIAVISATSVLTSVISDTDIQSYLKGLPSYFFTMILFASVFLLKLPQIYTSIPFTSTNEAFEMAVQVAGTLRKVSTSMHQKHLLTSIVHGLEKMLSLTPNTDRPYHFTTQASTSGALTSANLLTREDSSWIANPLDMSFWESIDLFSTESFPVNFDLETNFGL